MLTAPERARERARERESSSKPDSCLLPPPPPPKKKRERKKKSMLCRDKMMFAPTKYFFATKMILVAAPANDSEVRQGLFALCFTSTEAMKLIRDVERKGSRVGLPVSSSSKRSDPQRPKRPFSHRQLRTIMLIKL